MKNEKTKVDTKTIYATRNNADTHALQTTSTLHVWRPRSNNLWQVFTTMHRIQILLQYLQ